MAGQKTVKSNRVGEIRNRVLSSAKAERYLSEPWARWWHVRRELKLGRGITSEQYVHLQMHVAYHDDYVRERGAGRILGRWRVHEMQKIGERLEQYEKSGKYLVHLRGRLEEVYPGAGPEERKPCIAVVYGEARSVVERQYLDHTTIAYGPEGYERLILTEGWLGKRIAGSREGGLLLAECPEGVGAEAIAALWDPHREGFLHDPAKVVRAHALLSGTRRHAQMPPDPLRSP